MNGKIPLKTQNTKAHSSKNIYLTSPMSIKETEFVF